jgi:hypothetical protein
VSLGDCLNNRETDTRTRDRRIEPIRPPLESIPDDDLESARDAVAIIVDLENHVRADGPHAYQNVATAVTHSVREHVHQCLLDACRVDDAD